MGLYQKSKRKQFKSHDLLKQFEGLSLNAYLCSANVWTIGYGSTRGLYGTKVERGDTITLQEAKTLLERDLEPICKGVNDLVNVEINQNQFDALVSLSYNIGLGSFKASTLLRKLNNRKYDKAAEEFPKWRKAGGKILQGLVDRRLKEKKIFEK
jgi:lysozyme